MWSKYFIKTEISAWNKASWKIKNIKNDSKHYNQLKVSRETIIKRVRITCFSWQNIKAEIRNRCKTILHCDHLLLTLTRSLVLVSIWNKSSSNLIVILKRLFSFSPLCILPNSMLKIEGNNKNPTILRTSTATAPV